MDAPGMQNLVSEAQAHLEAAADKGDEARVQALDELLEKLESELDQDGSTGR